MVDLPYDCVARMACADTAPAVLTASGLRKAYGAMTLLDGIDLQLSRGEVVLLEGENGSGKTTLINILAGDIAPDSGTISYRTDGRMRTHSFPRCWWQQLAPFDRFSPEYVARCGVGRTWQDIRLFGSQSLRENIALFDERRSPANPVAALIGQGDEAGGIAEAAADTMLAQLGLAGRETSFADAISLGQSQRVAIARAVAAGADILFLDEPLAGLDRQGVADVLALLGRLVSERGLTLVIVEHILNHRHLRPLITTRWRLTKGRIEVLPFAERVPATAAVRAVGWIEQLGRVTGTEILERGARLTRIQVGDRPLGERVLDITGLTVERNRRVVVGLSADGEPNGFDLHIHRGEIAVLQAPNGWGKSSLFGAITGLIRPAGGEISLRDEAITTLATWQRMRRGLRAFESDQRGFPNLRTREVLGLAGVTASAEDLGFPGDRPISSLSGGQRHLLGLYCHAADDARVALTLYDEPFSMLDATAVQKALAIIRPGPNAAALIAIPFAE